MYDLVVIGGGLAGRIVASAAARVGAKVRLVDQARLGDKTSGTACWPSKGLFQAARLVHQMKGTERSGIKTGELQIDFAAVMANVRAIAETLEQASSAKILAEKGVEIHRGSAAFSAYDTVQVDGKLLPSNRFVIATGARASRPRFRGSRNAGISIRNRSGRSNRCLEA